MNGFPTTSSLFSNKAAKSTSSTQTVSPRIPGLGYLVFSPSSNAKSESPPNGNGLPVPNIKGTRNEGNKGKSRADEEWETEEKLQAQRRQERLACEAEEACKGEEDWVRSGGVLRDSEGRRDWDRTNAIREELKLREIEKQVQERWDDYESRWNDLMVKLRDTGDEKTLRFKDIPWPVKHDDNQEEICFRDLNIKRIGEFLMEGLTVRNTKATKKDRTRSSYLRWHPDKLGGLVSHVQPKDVEDVKKGIGLVIECLQKLNS